MIIQTPAACEHMNAATETAVYRLHNEVDPSQPYFSVALRVFCPECKILFRFLGSHASVPEDAADAMVRRLGSWTSSSGDELGALISPFDPSGGLSCAPVAGRA